MQLYTETHRCGKAGHIMRRITETRVLDDDTKKEIDEIEEEYHARFVAEHKEYQHREA